LLDEFAHFSYESIALQVLASTHSVARCRAFISTPKGPASEFAQLRARMPEHCVYHMTWRADPRKPADYREQMIRAGMRPDLFEQEEEGRDVALSEQLMFSGPPNLELLPAWEKEPGDRRGPRPSRNIRALEYWDEEDDFRAVQAEEDILHRGFLAGGWDFGTSGVSALVCLHAVVEPGPRWRLWIDAEHKWHQTAWMSAADDVLSWVRYRYCPREPNHWGHWGDPAGIQTESDGSNWQNNLRSGGVPLTALHASYNTRDGQEWAFREAQSLIDAGRIRVHRRCTYLWSCLENWSRDIPHGSNPELISKLYIPPRHDGWSHGGMAFAYLLAGVLIGMSAAHDRSDQALATLPPAPGGSIASMLEMGG
jgi:hypothetical protein